MLEHGDHFDMYGTSAALLLNGVYASRNDCSIVADPDGASTQRVLRLDQNGNGDLRYVLSNEFPIIGVAKRIWLANLPLNNDQQVLPIIWRASDNSYLVSLVVETTGRMSAYTWSAPGFQVPTLIATTDTPVISAEGWWHIEARLKCSTGPTAEDGEFELRVEGVPVIEADGFNTWQTDIYQLTITTDDDALGAGPALYVKDYVVWNTEGDYNTDFLGAVLCINCIPNGDVDLGDWVPSTGSTATPILDNNPPVDAEYIEADAAAVDPVIVEMTNLPPEITTVKGVFTYFRSRKIDGGDGQQQVSMQSVAALSNGSDRPITSGFVYWKDVHEEDPNTNNPWTRAGVDASQFVAARTV